MKVTCKTCGAKCDEKTVNGKKLYVCPYCMCEYDEDDLKPATSSAVSGAPAAPAANGELTGDQIFSKVVGSAATIRATTESVGATASGFLISSKGFFLTNAHAVCQKDGSLYPNISVIIGDKTYKAHPVAVGEPLGSARGKAADLCLLWAEGDFSKHYINEFCNYSEVKNGQKEYIVGNPFGEGICITSGIVSDRERYLKGIDHPFLMTDAATNAGNSGGPHYNAKAEIIGVHVAGRNASEGMNYAVPANIAQVFISEVVKHERFRDVDFGELNKYRTQSAQSTAVVITGIKLFLDVIAYIISFFGK